MTFDSLTFLVFLALAYLAFWSTRDWTLRKRILLGSSYLFYGAWNPFFVLLLVATTGFDWIAARVIERSGSTARRRLLLAGSIAVNLGALAFFKYAQFLTDTAIDLARILGITYRPIDLGILLPVGISFYTFESLSYVVDVYKRRVPASRSLLDYGLYVTFFPHLVAGPILRYGDFDPQTKAPMRWADTEQGRGLAMFAIGLALKVLLADLVFAPVSDRIFDRAALPGTAEAWLGASAFSLQVYCDFAGYSLCAIGVALLFGFRFPPNFESPFGSIGMAELWTRWHMSLSSWLRDYVFNPLGGYRRGRVRGHVNLMVTFLLCGLWHGAAWTFVIWGGLNGLFQVLERVMRDRVWDFTRARSGVVRSLLMLATFGMFTIAVVFFRAPDVAHAVALLRAMAGLPAAATASALVPHGETVIAIALGALVLAAHQRSARVRGWAWLSSGPTWQRTLVVTAALAAIAFSPGFNPAFIYFQF